MDHHLFTLVEGLTPAMYATLNVRVTHLHLKTLFPPDSRVSATSINETSNPLVAFDGSYSFFWQISYLKTETASKQCMQWYQGENTTG